MYFLVRVGAWWWASGTTPKISENPQFSWQWDGLESTHNRHFHRTRPINPLNREDVMSGMGCVIHALEANYVHRPGVLPFVIRNGLCVIWLEYMIASMIVYKVLIYDVLRTAKASQSVFLWGPSNRIRQELYLEAFEAHCR
jgi:hypothetical protein